MHILDTFAPVYRAEDVYAANLAGSLECLNAGITTLVDWSHINNTPDHPDAAIQALHETGIRAQYAYGSANTSLADYWNESNVVVIDATPLSIAPVIDPVAAVTLSADVSSVETVIVAGVSRKRDGHLLANTGRARELVEASHDHLIAATQPQQATV